MLELNLILRSVAFLLLSSTCFTSLVQSACKRGCDLALGSYYVEPGINLVTISQCLNTNVNNILKYNPSIPSQDSVEALKRYNLPFRCDCINGEFLAHVFDYDLMSGDTYEKIAEVRYANLTTGDWIQSFNTYEYNSLPDIARINVTVNCSCGDRSISKDYGLFLTYPLRPEDTLDSISSEANLSPELILSYNPNVNFTQGSDLVYIPGRGKYLELCQSIFVSISFHVVVLIGQRFFRFLITQVLIAFQGVRRERRVYTISKLTLDTIYDSP